MTSNIEAFMKSLLDEQQVTIPKVYSKVTLTNNTRKKLLSYQEDHVVKLITILLTKRVALDASDTGVGKSYIAAAICKELGRRPVIICPKTIIYSWLTVLDYFGITPYSIVNYETLKVGKSYRNTEYKSRIKCPYLDIIQLDPEDKEKYTYRWNLPNDTIVIWDEVHRCKEPSTENGKLLVSTKELIDQNIPLLMLSATVCEKITDVKIPFYLFNIIPSTRNYNHYIRTLNHKYPEHRLGKKPANIGKYEWMGRKETARAHMIYQEIKDFTSRIKIKDLGDKFPSNQICCQQFIAEDEAIIAQAYEEISKHMKALKSNIPGNYLAKIQKLRQEIELRKIPIFIEQAQLYLDDGKSVVIFVNFLKTMEIISAKLNIRCKIHGNQTMEERQEAINLFQNNTEKIIICQIRAGGVGISLHDLRGGHPRVSLINFPDRAADLIQALGRIPRSGTKSISLQRIIFVANVDYEKRIMQNIKRKLSNLSITNDGDLTGYKYDVKKITRKVVKGKK